MLARGHHQGNGLVLIYHLTTLPRTHLLLCLVIVSTFTLFFQLVCCYGIVLSQRTQTYRTLLFIKLALGVQLELMIVVVVIGQPRFLDEKERPFRVLVVDYPQL